MNIYEQLVRDEGDIPHMYKDSLGIATIGVGHNLEAKDLSWGIRMAILGEDVFDATRDLLTSLPWTAHLSDARRGVLINMCFNMGIGGLLQFKNTLKAIQEGRWEDASKGMLDSKWAKQVGERAVRLAKQMRTDKWV